MCIGFSDLLYLLFYFQDSKFEDVDYDEEYEDSRCLLKYISDECRKIGDAKKAVKYFIEKHKTDMTGVQTEKFLKTAISSSFNKKEKIDQNLFIDLEEKRGKKAKISEEKLQETLTELKDSIVEAEDINRSPINLEVETLGDILINVGKIKSKIIDYNTRTLKLYYELGKCILYIKNYCEQKNIPIEEYYELLESLGITYKKSHLNFLCSFYFLISEDIYCAPYLSSSKPISFFSNHWPSIKQIIKENLLNY